MAQTVVFDFDGVIHKYSSGFKGITVIPDGLVDGIKEAIEEIRNAGYEVVVVSSRCRYGKGLVAVKSFLSVNGIVVDGVSDTKPPAIAYIDDRAIFFDGNSAGLLEKIQNLKPWYKE